MSKQIQKQDKKQKRISKFIRTCERCGNEQFSLSPVFWCRYCKFDNGVDNDLVGVNKIEEN